MSIASWMGFRSEWMVCSSGLVAVVGKMLVGFALVSAGRIMSSVSSNGRIFLIMLL